MYLKCIVIVLFFYSVRIKCKKKEQPATSDTFFLSESSFLAFIHECVVCKHTMIEK